MTAPRGVAPHLSGYRPPSASRAPKRARRGHAPKVRRSRTTRTCPAPRWRLRRSGPRPAQRTPSRNGGRLPAVPSHRRPGASGRPGMPHAAPTASCTSWNASRNCSGISGPSRCAFQSSRVPRVGSSCPDAVPSTRRALPLALRMSVRSRSSDVSPPSVGYGSRSAEGAPVSSASFASVFAASSFTGLGARERVELHRIGELVRRKRGWRPGPCGAYHPDAPPGASRATPPPAQSTGARVFSGSKGRSPSPAPRLCRGQAGSRPITGREPALRTLSKRPTTTPCGRSRRRGPGRRGRPLPVHRREGPRREPPVSGSRPPRCRRVPRSRTDSGASITSGRA